MKTIKVYDQNYNDELEIKIGENAQDNWNIIDISSQNDLWFHLDNKPSPHVILIVPKKIKVHKQTILYCGMICKNNSKYNNNKNVSIIYTEIKNITKGEDIGSVITKKTNKIFI
jgi:predicted ribosome quality control (RQC) complex YloA/Tae2 family protein